MSWRGGYRNDMLRTRDEDTMPPEHDDADDLFVTLDAQAYERVSVPSEEQVRQVLREGQRDLREAASAPRPGRVNPKLRFR